MILKLYILRNIIMLKEMNIITVNILIPWIESSTIVHQCKNVCLYEETRILFIQMVKMVKNNNGKQYPNSFTKISKDKRHYSNEVGVYKHLNGDNIAPKLLSYGEAFRFVYPKDYKICTHCQSYHNNCYDDLSDKVYYYLTLTHCGRSISSKYTSNDDTGPGRIVNHNFMLTKNIKDLCYIEDSTPDDIVEKMANVLYELASKHGIYHMDVHPGNFLIDINNKVRIIDFESTLCRPW